ncbi:MAG: Transcriptional regulator [uncultured bacterium]|nr:MAG: Transcriptional regulator [uncultured bacterium]
MIKLASKDLCLELAKRLTAVRLQKAWTRETLAKNAQINIHTLKRFERTGQISLERLVSVANILEMGVEVERLFKPRQRVDIQNWQPITEPQRKRGKRKQYITEQTK